MSAKVLVSTTAIAAALAGVCFGYYLGNNYYIEEQEDEDYEVTDQAETSEPCKLVLVVRKDLQMTKGKIAAQCGHAAVACYEKAIERTPENVLLWKSQGQPKIALQCDSLEELQKLRVRAARLGIISEQIMDAGRTQVEPGSITVLGVGPAPISKVNEITGHLKLL